jgi:hypothetical protein
MSPALQGMVRLLGLPANLKASYRSELFYWGRIGCLCLGDFVEKALCYVDAPFFRPAHSLDCAEACIAKVRLKLTSARFSLSRYLRLFEQYRPIADKASLLHEGLLLRWLSVKN